MIPACTACGGPLAAQAIRAAGELRCPTCRAVLHIDLFPALLRSIASGAPADAALVSGEAACFEHSARRAVVTCARCGRFLCSLCDLELSGAHLCAACMASERREGGLAQLETRRQLYDRMAFALAIYPAITIYFTLLTAPVAIYLSVRYWRSPLSLVQPGRWRFVVATSIALLQLLGWGSLVYAILHLPRQAA